MVWRVGVVADTHVPEFAPALPPGLTDLLRDVNLILHAGDITSMQVLKELDRIAPTIAIRSDHDALDLPVKTVVEVGKARIGLIHGKRPIWKEMPSILSVELFGDRPFWWGGFQRDVLREFENVDAIVFGHFHRPYVGRHNGVLLFCPGAVYHLTPDKARALLVTERLSLLRQVYLTRRGRRGSAAGVATIGLLTIESGRIEAQIIPIDQMRSTSGAT